MERDNFDYWSDPWKRAICLFSIGTKQWMAFCGLSLNLTPICVCYNNGLNCVHLELISYSIDHYNCYCYKNDHWLLEGVKNT